MLALWGLVRSAAFLKWVAVAVAAGGLWWYVSALQDGRDRAEATAAAAVASAARASEVAEINAEAALQVQRLAAWREVALARERDAATARALRLQSIISGIDHAPARDDGPLSPVLRPAPYRLRGPGPAGGGDRDTGGRGERK